MVHESEFSNREEMSNGTGLQGGGWRRERLGSGEVGGEGGGRRRALARERRECVQAALGIGPGHPRLRLLQDHLRRSPSVLGSQLKGQNQGPTTILRLMNRSPHHLV